MGSVRCCSTLAITSTFLPLFPHIEHSNKYCMCCSSGWPTLCHSSCFAAQGLRHLHPSPLYLTSTINNSAKECAELKIEGEAGSEGGFSWWFFHGTLNLSTSFHSSCALRLPNKSFCNIAYYFVLYGQQAHIPQQVFLSSWNWFSKEILFNYFYNMLWRFMCIRYYFSLI